MTLCAVIQNICYRKIIDNIKLTTYRRLWHYKMQGFAAL